MSPTQETIIMTGREIEFAKALQQSANIDFPPDSLHIHSHRLGQADRNQCPIAGMGQVEVRRGGVAEVGSTVFTYCEIHFQRRNCDVGREDDPEG